MKIEKNQKITFSYVLWDVNGNELEKTRQSEPVEYLHGYKYILPNLETALEGHSEGDELKVEISCENAFGPYLHHKIISVPREDLDGIEGLKPGIEIEMVKDSAEKIDKKDMFWTPQTPDDLLSDDSPEDEEDEEDEVTEIYTVRDVRSDVVILDSNPPLAGKDLIFDIKILKVEPASFEEIEEMYLNSRDDEDPNEDLF